MGSRTASAPKGPTRTKWFLDTVTDLFAQINETTAEAAGRHLVMVRDGAMAAGRLVDPEPVTETFLHGVEGLLDAHSRTAH